MLIVSPFLPLCDILRTKVSHNKILLVSGYNLITPDFWNNEAAVVTVTLLEVPYAP